MVRSATEAEYAALFTNAKYLLPIKTALIEMGHKQPSISLYTDNATEIGIANKTNTPKISKSMDMLWHWLQDREQQKEMDIKWKPGYQNQGDYFTKHHPQRHHINMRKYYLLQYIAKIKSFGRINNRLTIRPSQCVAKNINCPDTN